MDIMQKIDAHYPTLSKGQKQIAAFIRENFDKAAFLNVSQFSQVVGVSEATVVRFASELGFERFQGMQRSIQEYAKTKLTSLQRIDITYDRVGKGDVLRNVLEEDIGRIKDTLRHLDNSDFEEIVRQIAGAQRIYILGVRSSASLANFLGFYLNLMFDHVKVVDTSSASEIFEQLFRVGGGDVLISISYPRYSHRVVQGIHFARQQGATVVGITDSPDSPIAQCSDLKLLARSDMASFVDSLVAPMAVVNALIIALGTLKKEEVSQSFARLESIWEKHEVYDVEDSGTGKHSSRE